MQFEANLKQICSLVGTKLENMYILNQIPTISTMPY